jgi:hypothetical protein
MNKTILVCAAVFSFTANLAFSADAAIEPAKQAKPDAFKEADTNGDGGLSRDELAKTDASQFKIFKANFDEMDADKDGKVTMQEAKRWVTIQRYKGGK